MREGREARDTHLVEEADERGGARAAVQPHHEWVGRGGRLALDQPVVQLAEAGAARVADGNVPGVVVRLEIAVIISRDRVDLGENERGARVKIVGWILFLFRCERGKTTW